MAVSTPPPEAFRFHLEVPVRWSDLDALGHVNNARYFTFFESARIAYFGQLAPDQRLALAGVTPVLARTTCDYLRPVGFPATLRVGARAVRVGTTSFEFEHLAIDLSDGQPVAVGAAVLVAFDPVQKRKAPLPAALREVLRSVDGV
jgi:acyl-CoA thioester hydrolase